MTIVVACAGRAAATAQAPVTGVVMVVASRLDGIALDPLCAQRATTIMLVRATADLSTERDMPYPGRLASCRAARRTVHKWTELIIGLR
jgi:hypothetical protein